MKKILALALSLLFSVAMLAACGSTGDSSTPAADSTSTADSTVDESTPQASGEVIRIGVIQYVAHDALDAAYEGFKDYMAEVGYEEGVNVEYDFNNAQGDDSNCSTIASKLVNDGCDIILAIATPAAIAVANATTDIPILITAVTDAADAGLVDSNEAPGRNVTGTSDLTPVAEQMELIQELVPDAQTVGFLYTSSESNSEFQINMARDAAEAMGLDTMDFTISSSNELQSVVTSMVGKVDVVYTPTDNLVAEGMSTVATICTENGIPVIVGEEGMVENGGLASISISYYQLGRITGGMAQDIIEGISVPAEMPIQRQTEYVPLYNADTAETLDIEIPEGMTAI